MEIRCYSSGSSFNQGSPSLQDIELPYAGDELFAVAIHDTHEAQALGRAERAARQVCLLTSHAGFVSAGLRRRDCFLRTQINSIQVLGDRAGPVLAEFPYDMLEVVDTNPLVVCLIVQGARAGVYYFDSPEVASRPPLACISPVNNHTHPRPLRLTV